VQYSTTTLDQGNIVDLEIRNTSDHAVDPSSAMNPNGVAIVCAPDLTPDGHTGARLASNENLFFMTPAGPMAPGAQDGRSGYYLMTADDIGTNTCEGVIVTSTGGWADGSITVASRLTNIPPVSFELVATSPTTT
jgi:hypothetical protein